MKCYITGATGCVGRNLIDILLKQNWDITVLHRSTSDLSKLKDCNVKFLEVNFHNHNDLLHKIDHADAMFHIAGNTSHWPKDKKEQYLDNADTTLNLASACIGKVKKFIYTSTGATIEYKNYRIHDIKKISNNYIASKRLSEIYLENLYHALDYVILQPIIVVGKYDYNSYSQIFTAIKEGKFTKAFPGRIAFCHAEDVAQAHLNAYRFGRKGEKYVLGGTYTTWLNFFNKISKKLEVKPIETTYNRSVLYTVALVMELYSFFSGKKPMLTRQLVSLLKDAPDVTKDDQRKSNVFLWYKSKSLDQMIDDCYDWMKSEGKI
jgi:nucleoside-diphosphate-sugar epimerase